MILDMPTKSERRDALKTLPTDLEDLFRGITTRIRSRSTDLGMRVLMWLHFARRPLKLKELQHALAVKKGHLELDKDNISSDGVLLDHCFGLVLIDKEIDEDSDSVTGWDSDSDSFEGSDKGVLIVRFTHFTVKEYFSKYAEKEFPNGCSYIAETCLTYLNFGGLRQHCMDNDSLQEKSTTYAFLNYAARYWGTYLKQQFSDSLTELATAILEHESEQPQCAIQALFSQLSYQRVVKKFSGVHATAYFGLTEYMAKFSEVELKDDAGQTPLGWAASQGDEDVVRLLVQRDGVDIDAKNNEGETPLMLAAGRGHEGVVRQLIESNNVDINAKDDKGKTPLMLAAELGREAVVRQLINSNNVDLNAKNNAGRTPLMLAAELGREAVVRQLIESNNVDVNAKNRGGQTPLMLAAYRGHEGVVRHLLERDGVEINAKDYGGRTALIHAAYYGQEAVVRLLLERDGVDIDAKDNEGKTALACVAAALEKEWLGREWVGGEWVSRRQNYEAVEQLLRARGSDLSLEPPNVCT